LQEPFFAEAIICSGKSLQEPFFAGAIRQHGSRLHARLIP
jgi:hypothetical protein